MRAAGELHVAPAVAKHRRHGHDDETAMTAHDPARKRNWADALAIYFTRRQIVIFLMGFSSGLPLLLGFSTLSFWLRGENVSLAAIGGLLTVGVPYSFKFVWAPVLDHVRLPFLARWLGLRRSWLIVIQILLAGSIIVVGQSEPQTALGFMALAAFIMAFLSASQDIVIDAYRIEILPEEEQGAGAAMTQAGYRIGMLVSGAGALALADILPWSLVYAIMAGFVGVGILATLIAEEPVSRRPPPPSRPLAFLRHATIDPLRDFTRRPMLSLFFGLVYALFGAVLIAGAGHARSDWGVPFILQTKAPNADTVSIGLFEVTEDAQRFADYENREGDGLPFDFIRFTQRSETRDHCAELQKQLDKN